MRGRNDRKNIVGGEWDGLGWKRESTAVKHPIADNQLKAQTLLN